MARPIFLPALLALCAAPALAPAQPLELVPKNPIGAPSKLPKGFARLADVTVDVVPAKAKWGETVVVKLTITPKADGYTYPAFPKDAKQDSRNTVEFPPIGDLIFIGTVTDPPVVWKEKPRDEKNPGGPKDQYTDKPVTWELKAVVSPKAAAGKKEIALDGTRLQVCDHDGCNPARGKQLPPVTVEVVEGASDRVNLEDLAAALEVLKVARPALPVGAARGGGDQPRLVAAPPAPSGAAVRSESRKAAKSIDAYTEELKAIAPTIVPADESATGNGEKQTGLWAFVATAAAWGLISLVTPCVFPMIPITVSIFLKQAHGSFRERLKLAGVYSLTIISVLGVSAFALLKFMAWLSAHPVTNVLLAALFLVLALSLFGMYEIALPNVIQKRLQARQAKGGVVGTIFGALAFTVISFTCVAPFLGGFAGISAGNDGTGSLIAVPTAKEIAGGLAFATAFAAPFFVLALVPGLMKALPKSGGWLDSVKVVMGFLELAAALKFLRTAEIRVFPTPQYFTYDLVLGGWVAISAACGLYLLNVFRLPHDEEKPNIGVPRLLFALLFLGLALYLAPGLLRGPDGKAQRPAGTVYAWVEAFLLPEVEEWPTDLKDAIERSRVSGKPIFVDFTGKTCTNCRYNEQNVFTRPEIRSQFDQFELVQLYTDEVPARAYSTDPGHSARIAEAEANGDFQVAVLKDNTLPTYLILLPQPDGKVKMVKYPEGKINNPDKFEAFLKGGLAQAMPKK
ncbi:MAG: thioredoxin family protein [Planctomycetes bacterium]|nr:thioredoxin family protein [Planctomycetota bacterium]